MFASIRAVLPSATSVCSSMTKNKFIRSHPTRHPSEPRVPMWDYSLWQSLRLTFIKQGPGKRSEQIFHQASKFLPSMHRMLREDLTKVTSVERSLRARAKGTKALAPGRRLFLAGGIMRVDGARPWPEAQCVWECDNGLRSCTVVVISRPCFRRMRCTIPVNLWVTSYRAFDAHFTYPPSGRLSPSAFLWKCRFDIQWGAVSYLGPVVGNDLPSIWISVATRKGSKTGPIGWLRTGECSWKTLDGGQVESYKHSGSLVDDPSPDWVDIPSGNRQQEPCL